VTKQQDYFRNTSQYLMPHEYKIPAKGQYDIYPSFPLVSGEIHVGFDSMVPLFHSSDCILIDGYIGVLWESFISGLQREMGLLADDYDWVSFSDFMKSEIEINHLVEPFLGGSDPLFGKRTNLNLSDFFDLTRADSVLLLHKKRKIIVFGSGAFLANNHGFRIYIDVPKNELQYRARARAISNFGCLNPDDPKAMYKRFYFVDWVVLNRHKEKYINEIDVFCDNQNYHNPVWTSGSDLRASLETMSMNYFRVRPWFEPGTWGGKWILDNIKDVNKNVPNYAWSFELIVPENGLVFHDNKYRLEVSFDWLMYFSAENVLGSSFEKFGNSFPIRFDFLDTVRGGNLSIQVHPNPEYILEHFGEDYTQEESYYILDNENNASVYLGFAEGINPKEFQKKLEDSFKNSSPVEIEDYVMKHSAHKHDLFLIPYGTIHGSGSGNLVLEISTTPYIFTFKLYDWLRPDLDGKPRPLNIKRGVDNLHFDRQGQLVNDELLSKPVLLEKDANVEIWNLPTHSTHSYSVNRYCFADEVVINTHNKAMVMSLVEGSVITLITESGMATEFSFAETFVVPAAAKSFRLVNNSDEQVIVVAAYMK
jgi:mannose-6-phosphate isomerase class I